MARFSSGAHIVVRYVRDSVVRTARPVTVVSDSEECLVVHLAPGTRWYGPQFENRANAIAEATSGNLKRGELTWERHHCLMLTREGDSYTPWGFWDSEGTFLVWYINLQEPMRRTSLGYDTRDQILDIVLGPDMSWWQWKDEEELEEAVSVGLFDADDAVRVREQAERVIALIEAGDAWWAGWRDWLPDESSPIPALPSGWNAV